MSTMDLFIIDPINSLIKLEPGKLAPIGKDKDK